MYLIKRILSGSEYIMSHWITIGSEFNLSHTSQITTYYDYDESLFAILYLLTSSIVPRTIVIIKSTRL